MNGCGDKQPGTPEDPLEAMRVATKLGILFS
jgi:hypothetical protein